jgi:hypothetical protein
LYPRAGWYFGAALAVIVAGFFPSYFARLRETDAVHHFHGIVATTWMLLLVVQAQLAASPRRWKLHRQLGWTSVVIAPLLVVSGLLVVRVMLRGETPFNRAFGHRLAFLDLTTLAFFSVAYVLALKNRRDQATHARWIATTALVAVPPGLARLLHLLGVSSFAVGVTLSYVLCGLIALALIWDDRRKGAIRLPYSLLVGLIAVQIAGFWLLA